MKIHIITLIVISLIGTQGTGRSESVDSLNSMLSNYTKPSADQLWQLRIQAIDCGSAAIPYLEDVLLNDESMLKRSTAGQLLAIIGGERAVDILQKAYESGVDGLKEALCIAIASRGNEKDVNFLVRTVREENNEIWIPMQAALTLGVLRAREAIPDLELAIKRNPSNRGAFYALDWIKREPTPARTKNINGIDGDIISAMFRSGIPMIENCEFILDKTNGGMWRRSGKEWIFTKGNCGVSMCQNRIEFDIHVSSDEERAIAGVSLYISSAFSNYNYILKRAEGSWRVSGLLLFALG
jgi:hypothetical protein